MRLAIEESLGFHVLFGAERELGRVSYLRMISNMGGAPMPRRSAGLAAISGAIAPSAGAFQSGTVIDPLDGLKKRANEDLISLMG
jgi:hypothetical protein